MYVIKNGRMHYVDDELYHFKYIKREWKGGRWVYTYDTSGTEYDQAKRDVVDAFNKAGSSYKGHVDAQRNADNTYRRANEDGRVSDQEKLDIYNSVDQEQKARDRFDQDKAAYEKVVAEYENVSAKTLIARTTAKTVAAVANFITSVAINFRDLFIKPNKQSTSTKTTSGGASKRR